MDKLSRQKKRLSICTEAPAYSPQLTGDREKWWMSIGTVGGRAGHLGAIEVPQPSKTESESRSPTEDATLGRVKKPNKFAVPVSPSQFLPLSPEKARELVEPMRWEVGPSSSAAVEHRSRKRAHSLIGGTSVSFVSKKEYEGHLQSSRSFIHSGDINRVGSSSAIPSLRSLDASPVPAHKIDEDAWSAFRRIDFAVSSNVQPMTSCRSPIDPAAYFFNHSSPVEAKLLTEGFAIESASGVSHRGCASAVAGDCAPPSYPIQTRASCEAHTEFCESAVIAVSPVSLARLPSQFPVGAYSFQGSRSRQEDRFVGCVNINREPRTCLFAVFDGHGGTKASEFAASHLADNVAFELRAVGSADLCWNVDGGRNCSVEAEALRRAFLRTDFQFNSSVRALERITKKARAQAQNKSKTFRSVPIAAFVVDGVDESVQHTDAPSQNFHFSRESENDCNNYASGLQGTTAVAAFFRGNKLAVANVGDSRCVLVRSDGSVIPLSKDHRVASSRSERARILGIAKIKANVDVPANFELSGEVGAGPADMSVTRSLRQLPGPPVLEDQRVAGLLAVSRAIGDQLLKDFVIAEPEIIEYDLRSGMVRTALGIDAEDSNLKCDDVSRYASNCFCAACRIGTLNSSNSTPNVNGAGPEARKTLKCTRSLSPHQRMDCSDLCLVLCSDGVWDVLSNERVGQIVLDFYSEYEDIRLSSRSNLGPRTSLESAKNGSNFQNLEFGFPIPGRGNENFGNQRHDGRVRVDAQCIARALVDSALQRGSQDNITAVVVDLSSQFPTLTGAMQRNGSCLHTEKG